MVATTSASVRPDCIDANARSTFAALIPSIGCECSPSERARCSRSRYTVHLTRVRGVGQVDERLRVRSQSAQHFEPLAGDLRLVRRKSREIAAGSCERCDQAGLHRIRRPDGDDRDRRSRLRRGHRNRRRDHDEHVRFARHQFRGQQTQAVRVASGKACVDQRVPPIDVPEFAQAVAKGRPELRAAGFRRVVEDRDARRVRPPDCAATRKDAVARPSATSAEMASRRFIASPVHGSRA